MAQRNETSEGREVTVPDSTDTAQGQSVLRQSAALVGRRVSFWSAIALPFVAILLLVVQPSGWLPAVFGIFGANVAALYLGHCHDREC